MMNYHYMIFSSREGKIRRRDGKVIADNPKMALGIVVDGARETLDGLLSEVDICSRMSGKLGCKMLARYLNPEQATIASAPDGEWTYKDGELLVDGKVVPKKAELYEVLD